MEEFLSNLAGNSSVPVLTAALLGLLTAISPCPMATNITAIGYLIKEVENKRVVFLNGMVYTLGRALSYTLLALILFLGADQLKISGWFQQNGEKIIGPLLILIGFLMLDIIRVNFPGFSLMISRLQKKGVKGYRDVLFLGIIFALAFCPYSGVLYFGMLIPMTISSVSGLYLPVIFAFATGIPVIIVAWLLAYTVSGVGKFYNGMKIFEVWFRRTISIVFIGIGVYYVVIIYF